MLSFLIHCTIKSRKRGCAMPPSLSALSACQQRGKPVPVKKNIVRQPSSHREATAIASQDNGHRFVRQGFSQLGTLILANSHMLK